MTSAPERTVKASIQLQLGSRPDVRLFNNPVGQGWMGDATHRDDGSVLLRHARPVRFGLAPGSSDLIGWTALVVTPEMIGWRLPVFTAIECKTATGRPTQDQLRFIDIVRSFGGIAGVARSPGDATMLIAAGPAFPHT